MLGQILLLPMNQGIILKAELILAVLSLLSGLFAALRIGHQGRGGEVYKTFSTLRHPVSLSR